MLQRYLTLLFAALLTCALFGCGPEEQESNVDEDRGPIETTLDFAERINWPGVDEASGRVIPFIRGFGNGRPAAYWFLGFASRETADSFWFCREGDEACPLDANQRLNWDALVGNPLFTRIPGRSGFSPFWQMWLVTVPADYEANSVKTTATLDRLEREGALAVEPLILDFGELFGNYVGPQEVLLHCALVLAGSELENNGGEMPDDSGRMLRLESHIGWHEGFRVEFVDFSPSDGVFPEADDSEGRPLMPFANIYIHWRDCEGADPPPICDLPGHAYTDRRPVSERGLGEDITDDGDPNDTNNVVGSLPCELQTETENAYSPLWGVQSAFVPDTSTLSLMDTYADQALSDIMSADELLEAVDLGLIEEPEPQTEDTTGNPVPGNEGQIFFNCPNPVAADYVPFPCSSDE